MMKKGGSNLEIILSFIIFIGFIFFLFMAFPITPTEKSKIGLDIAEKGLLNSASVELVVFSIDIKEPALGCFSFKPEVTIEKVVVFGEGGNEQKNAKSEDGKITVEGGDKFYYIYSSSNLSEKGFTGAEDSEDCETLNLGDYELGLIRRYDVLSYSKLEKLNKSYYTEYSNLHDKFSMPKRDEFGFVLREVNGIEIMSMTKRRPMKTEVLSRESPIQIVYKDGSLKYALLNVQIW